MELTLADQYYLKARDHFPYCLEDAVENLNYALSYDDEHVQSHCLLGRVHMYELKDYAIAAHCFRRALYSDPSFPDVYKYYSLLKIWQGDYDAALILVRAGLRVKGMNVSILFLNESLIYECQGQLRKARAILKKARLLSIDRTTIEEIDQGLCRIKRKVKVAKSMRKKQLA